MKQEIKERVERIRKGEVPEGYIKSKFGIYPDDWIEVPFYQIFDFGGGFTASRSDLGDEGIAYLHYGDIHRSNKNYIDVKKELCELPKINIGINEIPEKYLLKDGCVVFADASEDYEAIGKSVTIFNPEEILFINGLHTIVGVPKNGNLNKNYSRFFLLEQSIRKQRMFYAQGISVLGISKEYLQKIVAHIASEPEQQKIAEILSTWDKAIELKEKLIEEKKELKQGVMQNIIFAQMNDASSWKFTRFKEIFKKIKRPIDKHPEEEYKRLTVKRRLGGVQLRDIKKGKEILVDSQHIVKEGDFIISKRQVFHGAIGVVQKKLENSIISMEYSILRCNEGFDTDFLFYCMYSPQFKKTIIKRTQGVHEEKFVFLFNEWYKTLGLHIPSIDEQKSTVSVLNNLNENIQILTNEVAQLKVQKRGLMQLLLTGIVRVEVN